ncbi:TPA: hypothetical protein QDB07_000192 [Burkholderia vietnamiensis]|nr:hypothetical protein [Burkholderia vietnamiensis]
MAGDAQVGAAAAGARRRVRRLTRPRWYRFRTAPESRGDHAVHMSAGWMLVDRAVRFAACAVVDDLIVAGRRAVAGRHA